MLDAVQVVPETYDLILSLVPELKEFPRNQSGLIGNRIQMLALDDFSALCAAI